MSSPLDECCEDKLVPRETTIEEPKVCPKYKSFYWDVPKKVRIENEFK